MTAVLHLASGTVCATIALESDQPAPPVIIRQMRVFRQCSRSDNGTPERGDDTWRYDEVDAFWVR
jgi:hypothetical protein